MSTFSARITPFNKNATAALKNLASSHRLPDPHGPNLDLPAKSADTTATSNQETHIRLVCQCFSCSINLLGCMYGFISNAISCLARATSELAGRILACRLQVNVELSFLVWIATFYVLLMDVIRLGVPKKYDTLLIGLQVAALAVLSAEFFLLVVARSHCVAARGPCRKFCCLAHPSGYTFSFRFWVDVLALLSVVLDLQLLLPAERRLDTREGSSLLIHSSQPMRLHIVPAIVGTVRYFRLFRVLDRYALPIGGNKHDHPAFPSPPPSASTSPSSLSSPYHRPTDRQAHASPRHPPSPAGGTEGRAGNDKEGGRGPLPAVSLALPPPSLPPSPGGFRACQPSPLPKRSSHPGASSLEVTLFRLIRHRLTLALYLFLLSLALLHRDLPRFDPALPTATLLLHAAHADPAMEGLRNLTLASYLQFGGVGAEGGGGQGVGSGGRGRARLCSLRQGGTPETAMWQVQEGPLLSTLRESEVLRLEMFSFPSESSPSGPGGRRLSTAVREGGRAGGKGTETIGGGKRASERREERFRWEGTYGASKQSETRTHHTLYIKHMYVYMYIYLTGD